MLCYRRPLFAVALAAALISGRSLAQDAEEERSIALGYVGTSGNTDTSSFNMEILYTKRVARWTHSMKLQGLGSQENEITRAERYYFENKSDFALDDNQYLYGKGSYTDDRFSGFDFQASVSAGYGRYLVRRDNLSLEAFGGAGYRENHITDGVTEGEVIFTLGQNLDWRISESARLVQSLNSEIGHELTVNRFEIGLESNIIDRIATKLAFQARNTSDVPEGNKNTDTQTSVSLVYSF